MLGAPRPATAAATPCAAAALFSEKQYDPRTSSIGGLLASTAPWSQLTGWMERQEKLLELVRKEHADQSDALQQKLSNWFSQQEQLIAKSLAATPRNERAAPPPLTLVSRPPQALLKETPKRTQQGQEWSCVESEELPAQADLPRASTRSMFLRHRTSSDGGLWKKPRVNNVDSDTDGVQSTDTSKTGATPTVSSSVPTPTPTGAPVRTKSNKGGAHRTRMSRLDAERRSQLRKKAPLVIGPATGPANEPLVRRLVNNPVFDFITGMVLIANVAIIGYEVEYKAQKLVDSIPRGWDTVEYVFAAVFSVELILRIIADGLKRYFVTGDVNWNWLDFIIVVFTLVEIAIRFLLGSSGTFDNAAALRAVRLIRIVRVMRVIRVMKFFKSLRLLVAAVMHTVKTCVWTVMLLAIVLYTFGIVFTQAATDEIINYYEDQADRLGTTVKALVSAMATDAAMWPLWRRYGGLHETMLTLYMSTTGGLDWDVALEPMKYSLVYEFAFLGFISFVFFAVLNVVTGIFCQFAIEMARADSADVIKDQLEQKAVFVENLKTLFKNWGSGEDEEISLNQFEAHLDDEHMRALLKSIGIESDDAWTLFTLLDRDRGGSIDINEFVEGCLRLKGPAMTVQLAKLEYQQKFFGDTLADLVEDVGRQVSAVSTATEGMSATISQLSRKVDKMEKAPSPQANNSEILLATPTTTAAAPVISSRGICSSVRRAHISPPPPSPPPGPEALPGGVPEPLDTGRSEDVKRSPDPGRSLLQSLLRNHTGVWTPGVAPIDV